MHNEETHVQDRTVYVKMIAVSDLPLEVREQAEGLKQLYAVHDAEGQQLALHVVRAHRLWERYLADDAGVPMARLHQAAEKAEHQFSSERIESWQSVSLAT